MQYEQIELGAARYNLVRVHKTLRCTPAIEAKVTDRLWSPEDMIRVVDEWEARQETA